MPSAASSNARPTNAADDGQATVELALAMPVLMVMLLAGVQVGLVVRDHVAVVAAARNAAREASIGGDSQAAALRTGLSPRRLSVARSTHDGLVTITVRYRAPTDIPLVGLLVGDVELVNSATMALEPDT
jgi:hypothetical protein